MICVLLGGAGLYKIRTILILTPILLGMNNKPDYRPFLLFVCRFVFVPALVPSLVDKTWMGTQEAQRGNKMRKQ